MSDELQLRVKVVGTLNSNACHAIAFEAAGISVMGYHYGYLADLVAQHCIDVKFGVEDPDANGEYDYKTDTLRFKDRGVGFYATKTGRALIVHECTHALIDVTHAGRPVRRADHEAIAWIAQTIYSILSGVSVRQDGDFHGSLFAVATDAINGQFTVDPQAVSFLGAMLRGGDLVRAKKLGKTVPDVEIMDGIPCPRPASPPPMEADPG
jgi:hypothetical protein